MLFTMQPAVRYLVLLFSFAVFVWAQDTTTVVTTTESLFPHPQHPSRTATVTRTYDGCVSAFISLASSAPTPPPEIWLWGGAPWHHHRFCNASYSVPSSLEANWSSWTSAESSWVSEHSSVLVSIASSCPGHKDLLNRTLCTPFVSASASGTLATATATGGANGTAASSSTPTTTNPAGSTAAWTGRVTIEMIVGPLVAPLMLLYFM